MYLKGGWTVTVIEKAAPKVVLPRATIIFDKGFIATWWDESLSWSITGYERAWGDSDEILHIFGNQFVRLEPVSETAKKVLDRVRAEVTLATDEGFDGPRTRTRIRATLSDIARDLSVSK